MAEITTLERRHHAFYAPAYRLLVNGSDLLTSELVEITSVQVDSTLEGADRFSFTVNSSFDFSRREFVTRRGYDQLQNLFAFGSEVAIHMGYRDVSSLRLLHRGMITGISTSFPGAGLPQVTVSGYDLSYCMRNARPRGVWDRQKDSQIVTQIAGRYGLTAEVRDSEVEHARTEQHQQTDQEFLAMLAERNGYEVFTRDRTLYFRPPANDQAAVVTLEWGKGLVSFSPELNISEQVTEVEVHGWDVATKREIVGRAQAGDERGRDGGQRSGGEHLRSACRTKQALTMRFPVRSQQEADQKARSILKQRAEQFVKGNGESIGLPEILPDTNIELRGLGRLFSKTYYVEQATHTISTSGYRTTFRVKETTI